MTRIRRAGVILAAVVMVFGVAGPASAGAQPMVDLEINLTVTNGPTTGWAVDVSCDGGGFGGFIAVGVPFDISTAIAPIPNTCTVDVFDPGAPTPAPSIACGSAMEGVTCGPGADEFTVNGAGSVVFDFDFQYPAPPTTLPPTTDTTADPRHGCDPAYEGGLVYSNTSGEQLSSGQCVPAGFTASQVTCLTGNGVVQMQGPIRVIDPAVDPYNLDGDNDGTACEVDADPPARPARTTNAAPRFTG